MREHIRIDTIKVFDEENKALHLVMADHKTKNKSEGYREALKTYAKHRAVAQELQAVKEEVSSSRDAINALAEKNDDLYFVVRTQAQEIGELRAAIASQTALLHQALNYLSIGGRP